MLICVDTKNIGKLSEGAALLLGFLCSLQGIRSSQNAGLILPPHAEQNRKDGWFLVTGKDVQDNLGMSPVRQNRYLKELLERRKIEKKVVGKPPKRWIKLFD